LRLQHLKILFLCFFPLTVFGQCYSHYIDKTKTESLDTILKKDSLFTVKREKFTSLGYIAYPVWIKLEGKCVPDKREKTILEVRYPLEKIELFARVSGKWVLQVGGEHYQPAGVKTKDHFFTNQSDPDTPLYFKIQSSTSIQLPVDFFTPAELATVLQTNHLLLGIFFGAMALISLLLITLGITMKEFSQALLGLFLGIHALSQFAINRLAHIYLWPGIPWLNLRSIPFLISLQMILFCFYSHTFLQTNRPFYRSFLGWVSFLGVLLFLLGFRLELSPFIQASILYGLVVILACLGAGLYACFRQPKNRANSLLYLVGWVPFFLGFFLLVLKTFGLVKSNLYTNYTIQLGSLAAGVMFSFANRRRLIKLRNDQIESEQKTKKAEAMATLASQVAHDIRSPLAALKMITHRNEKFSPEEARIVKSVIDRISTIAQELLGMHVQKKTVTNPPSYQSQVLAVILEVASEKNSQWENSVTLTVECPPASFALFTKISAHSLSRLLSNLLDNSKDAVGENGQICIRLLSERGFAILSVEDNGCGIPPHILPKLTEMGFSYGKNKGSGLGLFSAKNEVEAAGGEITIQSQEKKGTTVTLKIPLAIPLENHVISLEIMQGGCFCVVDDDPNVFEAWKARLHQETLALGLEALPFSLEYYPSAEKFLEMFTTRKETRPTLYAIDYDLKNPVWNGIQILTKKNLIQKAVLVTQDSDNPALIEQTLQLKIKVLPKNLLPWVPIHFSHGYIHAEPPQMIEITPVQF